MEEFQGVISRAGEKRVIFGTGSIGGTETAYGWNGSGNPGEVGQTAGRGGSPREAGQTAGHGGSPGEAGQAAGREGNLREAGQTADCGGNLREAGQMAGCGGNLGETGQTAGNGGSLTERVLERNEVAIEFGAQSRNESFARMVAAAYAAQLNPTLEEISDIKTAVSEAVTNAVIHGYNGRNGTVRMKLALAESEVLIEITDYGRGMENVLLAMEPMYTTRADMERSGMGFAFMEAFMDELEVRSAPGRGTVVRMRKRIAPTAREE